MDGQQAEGRQDRGERLAGFQRKQIYDARGRCADLLADLEHIRETDDRAEAQQIWLGRASWLLGFPALSLTVTVLLPALAAVVDLDVDDSVAGYVFPVLMFALFPMLIGWPFVRARIFPVIRQPSGDKLWIAVAIVGTVVAAVVPFLLADLPMRDRLAVAVPVAILGLAAYLLHRRRRHYNVEDRRYLLLQELLPVLGRDIGEAPVHLRMDLRPPNVADKLKERKKVAVYNGTAQVGRFADDWLALDGRLLDGTRFELGFVEQVTVKNAVKGRKNKFKTKTKRKERASLVLRLKADKVARLAAMAKGGKEALQLPPRTKVRKLVGADDRIGLEVELAPVAYGPEHDEAWTQGASRCAVQMFLSLYQITTAARQLRKRAA